MLRMVLNLKHGTTPGLERQISSTAAHRLLAANVPRASNLHSATPDAFAPALQLRRGSPQRAFTLPSAQKTTAAAAAVLRISETSALEATTTAANASTQKLLLIDGHNMAFKAYWGMLNRPGAAFNTSDGIPTTVTFGFLRSLMALLEQEQPDALVVAFDLPAKSFRHNMLPDYKAQRAKAPPDFGPDLRNLQQLLRFLRIQTVSAPGYEADDVMAGAAHQAGQAGYTVRIYSTDQDLWQVIDDAGQIGVLVPTTVPKGTRKSKTQPIARLVDEATVRETLGISPGQVPDYKALVGDSSDNIPGIAGIGPKTAAALLQQHGSVERVFKALDKLKPAVQNKLHGQLEAAALYKDIASIRREAAPAMGFNSAHLQGFNEAEVKPLLARLELTSIVKALPHLQQLLGGVAPPHPELAAAIPEALAAFEASKATAGNGEDLVQQDKPTTAVIAGSAADLPFVQRPRCKYGPVGLLPESLQTRLPVVTLVTSAEQLQQLLGQLQRQQGPVTWSWPQDHLYSPGNAPPLPSYFCCAWDEPVQAQQQAAPESAAAHPASLDSAPAVAAAQPAAHKRTAKSPRPHRITATQGAAGPATVATATSEQPRQQQQQPAVALQPRLAVIMLGEQLPGEQVLSAVQPFLQDASRPKAFFESKRCYTELKHWGIQLEGVECDVLVAAYLTDPERWTEGKAKGGKVKALDPQRQQHQALPCMVHDVLNTTLPDMQAALEHEYSQHYGSLQETGQSTSSAEGSIAASGAAGDGSSGTTRSRTRSRLRRSRAATSQAEIQTPTGPLATTPADMQQRQGVQQSRAQQAVEQQGLPAAAWRAAVEAWGSHLLRGAFLQQLQQLGDGGQLLSLLKHVEIPVQQVLSAMEFTGIGCNRNALVQQKMAMQIKLQKLEDQLFDIAGKRFNLSARQQLSQVIYEELQIKPSDPKHEIPVTESGFKSTRESEIQKLERHPFISTYLEWLNLNTLLAKYYNSTYMDAINPSTGRVHTILAQVGGATGRINSSNPNLQNIPAHMHGNEYAAAFRNAFNHPAEGYVVVSADYSQVELRVLAALAHEQALLDAFAAGKDVHEATARVLLDRQPQEPVDREERQMGKRVNFSIVYGAGNSKIAEDAGVTLHQAKGFLDRFYAAYPNLIKYMTNCQRSAVAHGYTQSILGRRRLFSFSSEQLRALLGTADLASLPDMRQLMKMGNKDDAQVLRQAGNAPIQGTGADVLKTALSQLHTVLGSPPWNCRLLLTVHDSVVLEVPEDKWPAAGEVIASIMENVLPEHNLNLKVDVEEGL